MLLRLNEKPTNSIAVIDSAQQQLTYGELVDFSNTIKQHIPQRTLIFVLAENNVGGIAWTISMLDSRKLVPLILNVKTEVGLYQQLLDTYQPTYICAPTHHFFEGQVIDTQLGYTLTKVSDNIYPIHNDLSHLLPTSGSTGSPKLVRHKYENIEAAGLNISTFFELKTTDRPLMVLPLYYTMGLSMVFSHLRVGATILITGLSMTDPNFWKFLKEQCATSFTGVPYSFQVLNLMRFFRMNLPDMELLTQGGGKMPTDLNIKFAEYCRDTKKRWIATYGQSECTARMAYLPAKWALDKVGSIGIAVPNGELSLIDADGNPIHYSPYNGQVLPGYMYTDTGFWDTFNAMGYENTNASAKVLYPQDAYLKFGKTGAHSGLYLPSIEPEGSDVVLTFNWCAQVQGSGTVDPTKMLVELEGDGVCADTNDKISTPTASTQPTGTYQWQTYTVTLKGVTPATRILIRHNDMTSGKAIRFHLDNIKIVK